MRSVLLRASILGLLAVFSSSCILSRLTDRAFVGFTVKRPSYSDRKITGLLLLPITFALDVATFPLQVILLAVAGDDFILGPDPEKGDKSPQGEYVMNLKADPRFESLSAQARAQALAELEAMIERGELDRSTALGLTEDGHWVKVALTAEARAQLLERAKSPRAPEALALCAPR
jgi:hypothetical protein